MSNGRSTSIVSRRWILRCLCRVPVLSLAGCYSGPPCPLCAGRLSTVGSHIDFQFLPSANYAVWNRASDHVGCTGYEPDWEPTRPAPDYLQSQTCAPEFTRDSPFCTRCCHAFSQRDQRWLRAIDSPQAFVLPLSREMLEFPLPDKAYLRYRTIYEQSFGGKSGGNSYSDAIMFWYTTESPPSVAAHIEAYMQQHQLQSGLELAPTPGMTWVHAIYSGDRPKQASV